MTGCQKRQGRMSECKLLLPRIEIRKIRPTLDLLKQLQKICRPNQKYLTKRPINRIRPVLFAMANMPFGPVASTKRKLLLKEQKLLPSRSCVFFRRSDPTFRKCLKSRKCNKPDCSSTHNALLNGDERRYPAKDNKVTGCRLLPTAGDFALKESGWVKCPFF